MNKANIIGPRLSNSNKYMYLDKQREKLGEGKPETFDFLGFTHFCTRSRKWGTFVIGRKTIKKRMRAKLLAIKIQHQKKAA